MIWLYSGTPGSGKSYHAAQDILCRLKKGGSLICNFPLNLDIIPERKRKATFIYKDNSELTPRFLTDYAKKNHVVGVEGQTLVIIDECQIIFNSRDYARKDRMDWLKFFQLHRHLGYNFLLIAQNDRMLDRQVRALIENEVRHRKLNNYGMGGKILSLFTLGSTWFLAIEYWYGGNKIKLGQSMIRYTKKVASVYDSYMLFDDQEEKAPADKGGGWGSPSLAAAALSPPAPVEEFNLDEIKQLCNY